MEPPAQHTPVEPQRWALRPSGAIVEALPQHAPAGAGTFSHRIIRFSNGREHPPGIPLDVLVAQPDAAPLEALFDPLEPAFDPAWGVSTKIAVFIHFDGPRYRQQITVRRSTASSPSVSKGKLLVSVAREVARFVDLAAERGTPLRHNGMNVLLRELVVYGLCQISKGAWMPMLAIIVG